MTFVSKKFVERRAYSALFDPAPTEKRMPRWQRREKVKPRRTPRVDPPVSGTGRVPWYKKKKVDAKRSSS